MKLQKNIKIGKFGEKTVYKYIINSGWTPIAQNYKRKSDEIDIIAISSNGTLVFCEVKTMTKGNWDQPKGLTPEDNLTVAKLRKIGRTCEFFARKYPEYIDPDKGWQIDLFAVDVVIDAGDNQRAVAMRHYENIG
jgi:Holliday junction resolvase-like predicted endonuclease